MGVSARPSQPSGTGGLWDLVGPPGFGPRRRPAWSVPGVFDPIQCDFRLSFDLLLPVFAPARREGDFFLSGS